MRSSVSMDVQSALTVINARGQSPDFRLRQKNVQSMKKCLTPAPTGMDALGKHDFSIVLMLAGVHRVRTVADAWIQMSDLSRFEVRMRRRILAKN